MRRSSPQRICSIFGVGFSIRGAGAVLIVRFVCSGGDWEGCLCFAVVG